VTHIKKIGIKKNEKYMCVYIYILGMGCLTSSISSRETFLPSLLEVDTEAESVTGASVVWLFGWSSWDSCETWVEDCISCVLCDSIEVIFILVTIYLECQYY
jgi:hypothetical protein